MKNPMYFFRSSGSSSTLDSPSDTPVKGYSFTTNKGSLPPSATSRRTQGEGASRGDSQGSRRFIEISYSSTLLLCWAILLAILSWRAQSRMQAASLLVLCSVALTSEHGESRLLMPLIFLSERCLDHVMDLGHSPVLFYASTLHSYLTLLIAKAEQRGRSARDRNVIAETALFAFVGVSVVYFIVRDKVICLGAVAYTVSGTAFFARLLPILGDNEAVLSSSLVAFYICDIFMNNNLSIDGGRDTFLQLNAPGYQTSYTHMASRGLLLWAIYVMVLVSLFSRFCMVPVNRNSKSSERAISRRRITAIFWASAILVAAALALVISYQFRENVLIWLYGYIISSRFRRVTLLVWIVGIPAAVFLVDISSRNLRSAVRRKLFHFIAVVSFTPVIMIDPPFMCLAFSAAIALCVMAETARVFKVYGTQHFSQFMVRHIDGRESIDGVVRSHIYLLIGLGLSIILRYRHHQASAKPMPGIMELSINIIPGIVSLGIVDACAAICGSTMFRGYRRALGRYLKNKLFTERANSSITHKTTTGTLGGLVCGLVFWAVILTIAEIPPVGPVLYSYTMILVCSLTECFMDGIDNLQMPLVVFGAVNSLFALLTPVPELWSNPAVNRPNPTTAESLASALTSPWTNFPR